LRPCNRRIANPGVVTPSTGGIADANPAGASTATNDISRAVNWSSVRAQISGAAHSRCLNSIASGVTGKSTRSFSIAAYEETPGRKSDEYWKRTVPSRLNSTNGAIAALKHLRNSTILSADKSLGPKVGRFWVLGGRLSRTEAGNREAGTLWPVKGANALTLKRNESAVRFTQRWATSGVGIA